MKGTSWAATFVLAALLCGCTGDTTLTGNAEDEALQSETANLESVAKGAIRWIPDPFCGVWDGNGELYFVDCSNQISTFSHNGNAMVVAKASGVPNDTGQPVRWDAYNPPPLLEELFGTPAPCFVITGEGLCPDDLKATSKWFSTVSPSGEAVLQCHYAEQWALDIPYIFGCE